jgi:putative NADH-flavin reductase
MTTLVVGASGATGKCLVAQLLSMGQQVKVIVRPSGLIPDRWLSDDNVSIIKANINDIGVDEMAGYINDCQAVVSCLGHNLTLKGIYGKPRKLVADAVRLLCDAIEANSPETPVKFVLMNTAGSRNRDLNEPISFGEKCVTGLVRVLIPPHTDNEAAAEYLRLNIGHNRSSIEWVVVRPDTLTDEDKVTEYDLHLSPSRSAFFNPGKTSRINVGNYMATLITEEALWNKWRFKMPVIYNVEC